MVFTIWVWDFKAINKSDPYCFFGWKIAWKTIPTFFYLTKTAHSSQKKSSTIGHNFYANEPFHPICELHQTYLLIGLRKKNLFWRLDAFLSVLWAKTVPKIDRFSSTFYNLNLNHPTFDKGGRCRSLMTSPVFTGN